MKGREVFNFPLL